VVVGDTRQTVNPLDLIDRYGRYSLIVCQPLDLGTAKRPTFYNNNLDFTYLVYLLN